MLKWNKFNALRAIPSVVLRNERRPVSWSVLIKRFLFPVFSGLILLAPALLDAQKRSDLEKKRSQISADIKETGKDLSVARAKREAASVRLQEAQRKLESRQRLMLGLRHETASTDTIVGRTTEVIASLKDDVIRLKKEYSQMLIKAYRVRLNNNPVLFILSSDNFTKAFKRWQYFQQYDKYRKREARLISETQKSLINKNLLLTAKKLQKDSLLSALLQQDTLLTKDLKEKDELLANLAKEESSLTNTLETKEKSRSRVNAEIGNLIASEEKARKKALAESLRLKDREDARLARERAKTPSRKDARENARPTEMTVLPSPENLALSGDFRNNKGKLPWPVEKGAVSQHFGRQEHAEIKSVEIINNGVNIRTDGETDVRAVFNGVVSIRQFITGYNNVLILQHGAYYTVYSNLSEVSVKKGDNIQTGQKLGRVAINRQNGVSELHFEIWQEKNHLNPEGWMVKN